MQLAVPAMRRRGEGRIVNASSIAGDANGRHSVGTKPTKRALTTLSDALRPELAAWGVLLFIPGGWAPLAVGG
jgi:NAD(P)-dependent dehydrogenase (short-subunit alcohol dehydrogenase family)